MVRRKSLAVIPALLLSLGLSSCSIGYGRHWREAAASEDTKHPVSLRGAWEGTWRSEKSGHTGTLQAVVTTGEAGKEPARYTFRYRPVWKEVFSAVLCAEHEAKRKGTKGAWILSGEKDLGLLGGVYRFTGTASPTHFCARYVSSVDEGVFDMHRPERK